MNRYPDPLRRHLIPLPGTKKRYIDVEKDTQFSEAWVVLGIIVTLVGVVAANRFLTAAALALFVVAVVGWLWSSLSLAGLDYRRHLSEVRAFQGESVTLTLEISNRKPLPLTWLNITDIFPSQLPMAEARVVMNRNTNQGEFRTFWIPGAYQRIARQFHITCAQRGYHHYGPAIVQTGDGFGFFGRKATSPAIDRLIVYPRLYSVAELRLPTKNPFGDRSARGQLVQDPLRTVGIRPWQSGDSLRRVHWKATARHQELLSRTYEPSEEQQLLLFLNVATLVRHWHGVIPELLERTISVAASLAALAVEQRLPVGLVANGSLPGSDQPVRLLPGRSPDHLVRLLELLASVTSFATDPVEVVLLQEAPRLPWGATLVIVTAIAHDGLLGALAALTEAGRRAVLFTLAEKPPPHLPPGIKVFHLPHLVDDLIVPQEIP